MAKKVIAAATTLAVGLTAAEAAKPVEKKFTDKTYERLPLHAEVVVQVGPRQRMQKNKLVTVEEAKNVIFPSPVSKRWTATRKAKRRTA